MTTTDPLAYGCDACNAAADEPCRPGCIGEAAQIDTVESCDLGYACSFPPCVAERAYEEARAFQLYGATRPDLALGTYGEQMVDAGRGHLLRTDEL